MQVAFYAPMKPPDHPVPSGDRTMARALVAALELAGHRVVQPSRFRSYLAVPSDSRQRALDDEAQSEIRRLTAAQDRQRPDSWFTYHNYYKAPDLLGPEVSRRWAIPYLLGEASHAPKRASAWGSWHARAEAASRAADVHICFTARDRAGIAPLVSPGAALLDLPPFLDLRDQPVIQTTGTSGTLRLVTLAMMRPGDKLASYRLLASALGLVRNLAWHLELIGDGPARDEVAAAFSALPSERMTWHGELDRAAAGRCLAGADLFVWPGIGEAFGLAYLEAQAVGLPVLALDQAGVSSVVRNGSTGILVGSATADAYAAALSAAAADRSALMRMGRAARAFVVEERSLRGASTMLDAALRRCLHRERSHDD